MKKKIYIYDEVNKEEKKTRKRKIENIEDSEQETKPRGKKAVAKPRKC